MSGGDVSPEPCNCGVGPPRGHYLYYIFCCSLCSGGFTVCGGRHAAVRRVGEATVPMCRGPRGCKLAGVWRASIGALSEMWGRGCRGADSGSHYQENTSVRRGRALVGVLSVFVCKVEMRTKPLLLCFIESELFSFVKKSTLKKQFSLVSYSKIKKHRTIVTSPSFLEEEISFGNLMI